MTKSTIFFFFMLLTLVACNPKAGDKDLQEVANIDNRPETIYSINEQILQDSTNADLFNDRARYYVEINDYNSALADINRALSLEATNAAFFLTLSDIYMLMLETDKAKESLFKAIELEEMNPEPFVKLGKIHLILADYAAAIKFLDQAVFLDRVNPQAFFLKGFAYLETGDTSRAIENYQVAVQQDQEFLDAFIQLGALYTGKNDPIALDYYKNALDLYPEDVDLLYVMGMAYQQYSKEDEAAKKYSEILQIDSGFFKAHYNLGYLNLTYYEDFESAIGHFGKTLELKPDYLEAWYNRGLCFEIQGKADNARSDYKKALDIQPNYPKAIEGLNRI
ncbi:MAG: tetratricopeptide repeat protein, partial [Bacteroidales bacterium]|nr:tetratricopeptide repeat protein [Bacteroidales bacterium]